MPLNMNAIKKNTVQLNECCPKASQSISRVLVEDLLSFTQNLTHALLDFAFHCRQNET
jgi:hypothetical protein